MTLGWAAAACGETEAGLALARHGLAAFEVGGRRTDGTSLRTLLGATLLVAGRPGEASEVLDAALAQAESQGNAWARADTLRLRGHAALGMGEAPPQVDHWLARAVDTAADQGNLMIELRARADRLRLACAIDMPASTRSSLAAELAEAMSRAGRDANPPPMDAWRELIALVAALPTSD